MSRQFSFGNVESRTSIRSSHALPWSTAWQSNRRCRCLQMTGGAGFGVPGAAAGGPPALGGIQEMDEEDDDDDGALLTRTPALTLTLVSARSSLSP